MIHALYKAEERSARLHGRTGGVQPQGSRTERPRKAGNKGHDQSDAKLAEEGQATRSVQTTANNLRVAVNNNGNVVADSGNGQQRPLPAANQTRRRSTIHGKSSRKKSTDRTTRLLIVILVLFLLTEFPQVTIFATKSLEKASKRP